MSTTLDLVIETFVDREAACLGQGDTSETELALGQALGLLTLCVRELRSRDGSASVKSKASEEGGKHRHVFGAEGYCIAGVTGDPGAKICGKQKSPNGRKPAAVAAPSGGGSSS